MKKIFPVPVLFLIIFSYSFIFVAPTAKAECECYCWLAGSTTQDRKIGNATDQNSCATLCTNDTSGTYGGRSRCPDIIKSNTDNGSSGQVTLKDPLNLTNGPADFWARIIGGLLAFVGVAALVTFVYAGFLFLTSSGNPEQVKKAKDAMIYAVIGVAVSMGSYVILSFIFDILQGSMTG